MPLLPPAAAAAAATGLPLLLLLLAVIAAGKVYRCIALRATTATAVDSPLPIVDHCHCGPIAVLLATLLIAATAATAATTANCCHRCHLAATAATAATQAPPRSAAASTLRPVPPL
jgi:cytosine/uracil/thiamine/allantoin permease